MINRIAAALALLCLAIPATAQTSEDQWARCKGSRHTDPELTIGACTALIQAGTHTDAELSILFMNRGIAHALTRQRERALKDWERALSLDRTNSLIYYNRGLMFLDANELDAALRDAERGLQIQPQVSFRYHLIHAEALRRRGRFVDATVHFGKALSLPLDDPEVEPRLRALQAVNEQAKRCGDAQPDLSIGACTSIINDRSMTDDARASAYNTRSIAHGRTENWTAAVADHDESIRLNPSSAVFFANRGIAYIWLGRHQEAAQDFERSLALDPKRAATVNGQGLLARQQGDYARALERFTLALALSQQPPDATTASFVSNRGIAYLLMERYDDATIDLNTALSINPNYAFALFARGVVKRRQGDTAGGDADIAAAKAQQSDIEAVMARRKVRI